MIYGIGTDIIEINRFINTSEAFLKKVYTEREITLFSNKPNSLAGNFAAKEAVAKALGTGFCGFAPKDIEVLRLSTGKPAVKLYNGALSLFNDKGLTNIHISISHSKENACAFVIAERED